jgi:Fungal Zn(2)-Cys(6) binuclear cluster domain
MTVKPLQLPSRLVLPPPSHACNAANAHNHLSTSLMKPSQWSSAAGLDVPLEYPSPPMTDSPTSPNRLQFPEDRSGAAATAAVAAAAAAALSAPAVSSTALHPPAMTSQILPAASSSAYGLAMPSAPSYPDYGHGLQPRSRSHSMSGYQPPFMPTAPPHHAMAYGGSQPGAVQVISGPLGPVSVGNMPRIGRTGSVRRTKAHVARACQNCKKAHLSCDENRPCARCVATRKEVNYSPATTVEI